MPNPSSRGEEEIRNPIWRYISLIAATVSLPGRSETADIHVASRSYGL